MNRLNFKKLLLYVIIRTTFVVSIGVLSIHLPAFAAFDEINIGPRAQGVAGAFTAVSNDTNALFYNPAGLTQLKKPEFSSSYGRLFIGLDDDSAIGSSFVGFAYPTLDYGTAGLSWYNLLLSGLYSESIIGLSYAYPINSQLSAGVNLKNLVTKYGVDLYTENAVNIYGETRLQKEGTAGDAVFEKGRAASAFTADISAMYALSDRYYIGFCGKNITSPDVGIYSQDKVDASYRLGGALRDEYKNISVELMNKGSDFNIMLGVEKWFKHSNFGLRGGVGIGSRSWSTLATGVTAKFENLIFDYSFMWTASGISDTNGSHKIGITVKFGKPMLTKAEIALQKEREERLKAQEEAAKTKLETERIKLESQKKSEELKKMEAESKKLQQQVMDTKEMEELKRKAEMDKKYTEEMINYQNRVSKGAGLQERAALLEMIIKNYENKGVNVLDAKRELSSVVLQKNKAETDYASSFAYYKRLKAKGITNTEAKTLLNKIIEKYKSSGINISEAENELKSLK